MSRNVMVHILSLCQIKGKVSIVVELHARCIRIFYQVEGANIVMVCSIVFSVDDGPPTIERKIYHKRE